MNKLKSFLLLIIILVTLNIFGQNSPIKHLNISSGLSNNSVASIYQDQNGYMWFGTFDGLNRYDGNDFKIYRHIHTDPNSIQGNAISCIEGDFENNLWIGTTAGPVIFNAERSVFSPLQYYDSDKKIKPLNVTAYEIIAVHPLHLILVATKGAIVLFKEGEKTGMAIPFNGKLNYIARSISYNAKKQIFYVFITGTGLCKYDIKSKKLTLLTNSITGANCIKLTHEGLWIGSDEGAYLYNDRLNTYSKNYFQKKTVVRDFFQQEHRLWIATDGAGLYTITKNQTTPVLYRASGPVSLLNSKSLYDIFQSKNGEMWFGTLRGGVSMMGKNPLDFNHFKIKDPLTNKEDEDPAANFMQSFCEDENKNIWIGTDGAGMRYWNRKQNTYDVYSTTSAAGRKIQSDFVTSIVRDSDNAIWVAMWKGGVCRIDPKSKAIQNFSIYNQFTKKAEQESWLLFLDSKKTLWLAITNNGALYQFDRKQNKFICYSNTLRDVTCLYETKDGKIWGGTFNSFFEIEPKTKKIKSYHSDYTIRCITEDQNKNLWIGTVEGGLLLYNRKKGTFKNFTTQNGLSSNTILRLLEDKKGNLWMSTYHGISRLNTKNNTFRNFGVSDGLQGIQFSWNSGSKLSTGEFIFGGINGFNIFNPDNIKDKKNTGKFLLNDLLVNNQSLKLDSPYITEKKLEMISEAELPYEKSALSFDFVYLDYVNSEKINTAYFLEGWDKDWNYTSKNNRANYSRLTEGTYVFKVKTTDIFGNWTDEVTLATVKILPPWYRTWWAYTFYLIAVAGAIYAYIGYHKNKERLRYEIKLTRMEHKKDKEHAEKQFSMFTYIAHELRTPLSLIINPLKSTIDRKNASEDDFDLRLAYKNAKRLLSLTDQLLLFRKAETDLDELKISKINLNSLCRDIYESFTQMAAVKSLNYQFIEEKTPAEIYGDYEKIEITLFNLISNAFKFTPNKGSISIQVIEKTDDVSVVISDTGSGIHEKDIDTIFEKFKQIQSKSSNGFGIGLYVVKYFVNKHHGQITCTSKVGKGTSFTIVLPKGRSHFAEISINENYPQMSPLVGELLEGLPTDNQNTPESDNQQSTPENIESALISTKKVLLIVEDNTAMNHYLVQLFSKNYIVYSATNGLEGLKLVQKHMPDIVLSDISMEGMNGLNLCKEIKQNDDSSHIPVILLTATTSNDIHLQSITEGADDYVTKPFDNNILLARVDAVLRNRGQLRRYFLDSITLRENVNKVPLEYKEFLDKCIEIVEANLENSEFNLKSFSTAMGMSHSSLYKKIKAISGQTVNGFIRSIRIRRAAVIMLTENINIAQVGPQVGIEDQRYFRQQFVKLFGMKPSEYIKKYRNSFNKELNIIQKGDI
ncbi:hybrid sensor histidine kinase/response regulator transcription factor [Flavobacterium chungangense]|uniref:histidine kinase n=1 Tax=Flavobacterium chungangense TaxID=554283 RepID=A0A6V6YUC1_9FLAO|nr:two-component regulator propeller domain-containing protein [Flavobacterium chungangense]CAD0002996.1 hybrid sensor histidine kinase/response regulator [Flavobacterium chungangense]